MGTVTFLSPALLKEVTVRVPARGRRTLLSLVRKYRIPLRCDCSRGGCGSCAVKVATLNRQGFKVVRLNEDEKAALFRAGKLTPQQYQSEVLAESPPLWRLACQYVVKDEDILVAF